jgi:hypothetical protein
MGTTLCGGGLASPAGQTTVTVMPHVLAPYTWAISMNASYTDIDIQVHTSASTGVMFKPHRS